MSVVPETGAEALARAPAKGGKHPAVDISEWSRVAPRPDWCQRMARALAPQTTRKKKVDLSKRTR